VAHGRGAVDEEGGARQALERLGQGAPLALRLGEADVDRDRAAQVRREPGQEFDVLRAELALRRRAEHADVRHRAALAAGGAQVDQERKPWGRRHSS
jgi:hypothetical protein